MKNQTVVIGLGHKCRQGKDYLCKYMKEIGIPDVEIHILHFADALYKEARNEDSAYPLLSLLLLNGMVYIGVNNGHPTEERIIRGDIIPRARKLLNDRQIASYWGMEGKDSEFLQLWGTDIRRNLYDKDYWVNKLEIEIEKIKQLPGKHLILIPDTRFSNEVDLIKKNNGWYIEVERLNENGKRYIAEDRDPNHPSETQLDNITAAITVTCVSGDLESLKKDAYDILRHANRIKFNS